MRGAITFGIAVLYSFLSMHFFASASGPDYSQEIESLLPKNLSLENYRDAESELREHVEACGLGVVEDAEGDHENRCQYTIKIDDFFLRSLRQKTGYIEDPSWPFAEGIQWVTATAEQLRDVPERWDLEDHGEMIRIVKQQCGDCWAQATRANVEQLVLTHTGLNQPLSTQTLISSCCNTGSCRGGYMTTPGWVVKYGLPVLERDPYKNGSNSSCKFDLDETTWDQKLTSAPYVGNSLQYSRAIKTSERVGPKVRETQAMMMKYKSSAVVTISAISQSGGIIKRCSNINSGGNHMQDVVGWYEDGGDVIARVQNSWGRSHGQNGYTHIKWDCGTDRLNRGLGRSARVGAISTALIGTEANAFTGPNRLVGSKGVRLGKTHLNGQQCSWVPKEGLSDPESCNPIATPSVPTEYHLTARTKTSIASAMVLVTPKAGDTSRLLTPFGEITWVQP